MSWGVLPDNEKGGGEGSAARSNMVGNPKTRPRGSEVDPTEKKKPSRSASTVPPGKGRGGLHQATCHIEVLAALLKSRRNPLWGDRSYVL